MSNNFVNSRYDTTEDYFADKCIEESKATCIEIKRWKDIWIALKLLLNYCVYSCTPNKVIKI